jgi:cytochrome c peroxidase
MPAASEPVDNPSTPEKVELGRLLFHDPISSVDRKVACVTCHSQYWGMGDGLARSVGVGGVGAPGMGRTGPTHTRRNAPTLWNAAYRTQLFWDGRVASLEDQAPVPMRNALELGRDPADVATDLAAIDEYRARFAEAFPGDAQPVSGANMARAIASFVRTVTSDDAPYDRWVRGDARALSDEEVRGMFLFADAGCASCHEPPLFASDRYARLLPATADDLGRAEVTGLDADRGAFRVPTLRNLRETYPYFHDGSSPTIEDAVARVVASGVATRDLSADEQSAIVTFLHTSLEDVSKEPERPLTVPSGLQVPADGYRIYR